MIVTAILFLATCGHALGEIWTAPNTLTSAEVEEIVNLHNRFRSQYGASNMMKLKWDPMLAELAEGHAQHCVADHLNLDAPDGRHVGQNLAMSSLSSYVVAQGVNGWHNEKKFFDFKTFTCEGGDWKKCGHLTQVLAAPTQFLGCAIKRDCNGEWTTLMVCNYYPGQSMDIIKEPYKKGTACSLCSGAQCSDGLCSCPNPPCVNGNFKAAGCTCTCNPGYSGAGCGTFTCPAADAEYCGTAFPPSFCTEYSNVPAACPYMCGMCS